MDESGHWSTKKSTSETLLPLFSSPTTMLEVVPKEEGSGDSHEKEHKHKPKRKQSIMGILWRMCMGVGDGCMLHDTWGIVLVIM